MATAEDKLSEVFNSVKAASRAKPDARSNGDTPEGEDLGPCASRPGTKWWAGLHVHRGAEPTRSFQYIQLDFCEFTPTRFTLVFVGRQHWKVEVTGRNLWPIYNYAVHHRLEWIRRADRNFGDGQQPVITVIENDDVTPQNDG